MRKPVMILLLLTLMGSVYAQEAGQFSFGARAGVMFGFHKEADEMKTYIDYLAYSAADGLVTPNIKQKSLINFAGAVYGNYAFSENISVQGELDFMINQGLKYESSGTIYGYSYSGTIEAAYSSVDIPVLLKYTVIQSPLRLGILAGPYLSIPVGDLEGTMKYSAVGNGENTSASFEIDGINIGATAGFFAGYPAGPGRFVGDARFIFDFTTLKGKELGTTIEVLARRAAIISLGYEISF